MARGRARDRAGAGLSSAPGAPRAGPPTAAGLGGLPARARARRAALRGDRAAPHDTGLHGGARDDLRRGRLPPVRHVRVPDRPDRADGARAGLHGGHCRLRHGARGAAHAIAGRAQVAADRRRNGCHARVGVDDG